MKRLTLDHGGIQVTKYIRAELHNHITHSDGQLQVEPLLAYAAENGFKTLH
ncbi:hypothetical protein [Pygmaiobacter massiliensis]|uniref:hypothetical protein n=1 Tax=Pygmaiobacter massiliensis TaxID=1917873 RepID=UPI0015E0C8E9|nr:hypothetical protein [Pygmaiobacter massiliensis]